LSDHFEPYRRHWIEYAATLGALVVSVISLWVAIATEKANQKMVDANYRMVAAASWPFLQIDSGNDDNGKHRITLELQNAGIGPAKIQSFEVLWRGKAYASSAALLRDCCARAGQTHFETGTLPVQGVVLRPGDQRQFFRYDLKPDDADTWKAFDRVRQHELAYRACYCSVFDECWISPLNTAQARHTLQVQPVKACPTPTTSYEQ
jgi:hypothetical protein